MLTTPELWNSRFLKACRREPVDVTPVWIMRQAGRYLPEYMAVRSRATFMELCTRPELAAEVTLTAQQVLGVDAAILFADLLPMLQPMGMDLEYVKGEGPVIHNPLREVRDVGRVRELLDMDALEFTLEAVRLIRRSLAPNIPLLGFAGAPFTLASYCLEGGSSKHFLHTKTLMYSHEAAWKELMEKLARSVVRYLRAQCEAGCQAVQIFDSWAGCLSPRDYRRFVQPYTKMVLDGLPPEIPVINFLTGNPALIAAQREAGGGVIGLDWRVDLVETWQQLGDVAVQGNMDPLCLQDWETARRQATDLLVSVGKRPGHIFNLGHGVLPETPADNVKALVELVHEKSAVIRQQ